MIHSPVIRVKTINGKKCYTIGVIKHTHKVISNATDEDFDEDGGWSIFKPEPPMLYSGDSPLTEPDSFIKIKKNNEFTHLISPVTSGIIYHYTSWDTLFSGIMSQQNIDNSNIKLRAYNLAFMNDKSECSVLAKADFKLGIYRSMPVNMGESFTLNTIERNRKSLFATCFTKEIDSLPMWTCYGLEGKGIAIGLDAGEIWNQGFLLYNCIYGNDVVKLASYPYPRSGLMSDTSYELDYEILYGIAKDQHYAYEKECRVLMRRFFSSDLVKTRRDQFYNVEYGMKDGIICPYVEYKIPLSAVKSIYIGPTNNREYAVQSILCWLDHLELANKVEVNVSSAPVAY